MLLHRVHVFKSTSLKVTLSRLFQLSRLVEAPRAHIYTVYLVCPPVSLLTVTIHDCDEWSGRSIPISRDTTALLYSYLWPKPFKSIGLQRSPFTCQIKIQSISNTSQVCASLFITQRHYFHLLVFVWKLWDMLLLSLTVSCYLCMQLKPLFHLKNFLILCFPEMFHELDHEPFEVQKSGSYFDSFSHSS